MSSILNYIHNHKDNKKTTLRQHNSAHKLTRNRIALNHDPDPIWHDKQKTEPFATPLFLFRIHQYIAHQTTQPNQTAPQTTPHSISCTAATSRSAMPYQLPPLHYAVYRFDPTNSPPPPCTALSCHSEENEQEGKSYPAGRTKQNPLKLKNTPRFFLKKCAIIIYYNAILFPFIAHFALQTEYKRKGN